MQQTRPGLLFTTGIIGLIVSFGFNFTWESTGHSLPALPWPAIIGMIVLSIVLFVLGWPIKKYNDGDRSKDIDQLKAAKVAMLAKAAALAGSVLTGWYLGTAVYFMVSAAGLRVSTGVGMLVAVIAAAILMITGIVVESFCKLPPDDTSGASAA